MKTIYEALPKAEVIKAVERKKPSRIPMVYAKWWGEGLGEQYGSRLAEFDRFPNDVYFLYLPMFDPGAMNLSWKGVTGKGHDANVVIPDWKYLDEFIAKLPDPVKLPGWENIKEIAENVHKSNTYLMCGHWNLFFEKPWVLRGMENILCDYYENPDMVHKLHSTLCDFYCRNIEHAASVFGADGFWTSDDLGNQNQPMMKKSTFDEFLLPYYKKVSKMLKKHKLHFWLHSCGNNTDLLPSLIEAGLDMFHPVQKHTMDEKQVAKQFGDKLGFWSGFDVQHTLREGTPEQVRNEVRFLIDTFARPEGGMCISSGNGIVSGTPFENIEAFLEESVVYGTQHRSNYK